MAHCITQPPKKAKAISKGRRVSKKKSRMKNPVTKSFVTSPKRKKRKGAMRSY